MPGIETNQFTYNISHLIVAVSIGGKGIAIHI